MFRVRVRIWGKIIVLRLGDRGTWFWIIIKLKEIGLEGLVYSNGL